MPNTITTRGFTLARRELQESRNSLIWTPIAIAVGLVVIMLISVLLADRLSVFGGTMMNVLLDEESASGASISIQIGDDSDGVEESTSYTIEKSEGPVNEEDWDFSEGWAFEPGHGEELQGILQGELDERVENLNPILNIVHNLMLVVMFLVTANYLLHSLHSDRKDRSILFWRSMPVSEWEEILSKFGVAIVIVPAIFLAVSMLIQIAYVLIAMLLVWRLEMDPFELVLGNIEYGSLVFTQISGWLFTALWIAPMYAWLLLASSAAKRSPFFLAIAPILALVLIEKVFLHSEVVATALDNHLPHYTDQGTSMGFYMYGPDWSSIDYTDLFVGLAATVVILVGAVYLRRYRFEI